MKVVAASAAILLCASGTGAQLLPPLPGVGGALGRAGGLGRNLLDRADRLTGDVVRDARALARARTDRLRDLVAAHPDLLEIAGGAPAVRGQVIATDPSTEALAAAEQAGFRITGEERIEGLDLRAVTLNVPAGFSVERALALLQRIAPDGAFSANHLHMVSGNGGSTAPLAGAALAARAGSVAGPAVGIIDGGVAAHPSLGGAIEQRGFARGAPVASAHGTAVASLVAGRETVRGAAPGARLVVADIYGRDPAGGNALALARALGWMAERRVPVVAVSLVGPANPLVQRAVAAARQRGVQLVAAVGNDGPAAPPAYPASYPGVIAVTGVDRRDRALVEAGRSLHLDYAAPGADMAAAAASGGLTRVRGTSYAVPLVAGRMRQAVAAGRNPVAALDAEAVDLGPRGPDRQYGRGLVCRACRTPFRGN